LSAPSNPRSSFWVRLRALISKVVHFLTLRLFECAFVPSTISNVVHFW
jgi:hypothetical protein